MGEGYERTRLPASGGHSHLALGSQGMHAPSPAGKGLCTAHQSDQDKHLSEHCRLSTSTVGCCLRLAKVDLHICLSTHILESRCADHFVAS